MPRRNPLYLRLPGTTIETASQCRVDDPPSTNYPLETSPAKTTSDDGSEFSASPSPSTSRLSPHKKVSWSLYDRVTLAGHHFLLPRRFEAIELAASTSKMSVCCTATDLVERDRVTIRKISLQDPQMARREYRNIILCRLLPHPNILSITEAYEVDSTLYTVSEQMDGRLSDIVEERLTHFVVAKISHQMLAAVAMMHKNRIAHGDLTLSTILVNTDAELRLASYGKSDDSNECLDEKFRDDLLSIGAILSRLLMNEDEMVKLSIRSSSTASSPKTPIDLHWRVVLEGSADSGLLDFNARSLLFKLLEGRYSAEELLHHPYFKSFRAPRHQTVERKHTIVGVKTSDEVLNSLREELQRFNPFNMSEVML